MLSIIKQLAIATAVEVATNPKIHKIIREALSKRR